MTSAPTIEIRMLCRFNVRALAKGAAEFYSSSKFLRKFDIEKFCTFWKNAIAQDLGIIFVAMEDEEIVGAIGAMALPEPYSGELAVHEFFWFVRPGHRGTAGIRLYKQLEKWAREKGASLIRMVHLMDSMPEKLSRFYGAMGFQAVETVYSKDL